MNTVKVKPKSVDNGMDHLSAGETIRIPTGVESDKYYIPAPEVRSPSIVLIGKSNSPNRGKLNKYQEVPRIPTKSRIPVLQKSPRHSSLRVNDYGQPLSASTQKSSPNLRTSPAKFHSDKAAHDNQLGQISPSRNLAVLPAIGVGTTDQGQPKTPNYGSSIQPPQESGLLHAGSKQYYQPTTTKPVFQMRAEYNNMLQKYASNLEQQQATSPRPHHHQHHHHSSRVPCKGCGRHVAQKAAPVLPSPAMGQSYVQQWLVNPSHPYQLPPQGSVESSNEPKQSVSTVPLVFSSPNNNPRKQAPSKPADVPIRYTQAPTHQMVNKISGKLLTPEDALKKTLKRKKIPPLTKRNSLRSIFSDASGSLQKIAEEKEEDWESNSGSQGLSKDSRGGSRGDNPAGSKHNFPQSVAVRKVIEPGTQPYNHQALLSRLLLEAGSLALLTVFNNIYPPLSLADHLSKPQLIKTLRRMKSQGALTDDHWELLYPKKKAKVTADSFGSTLLLILLRSICHLSPPYPNGWTELPLLKDKGLSADLARIAWYWNHVASLSSLTDDDFSNTWTQLSDTLNRLAGDVCPTLIKRIQREVLDAESQHFYIKMLASSRHVHMDLVEQEKPTKPQPSIGGKGSQLASSKHISSALTSKSGTFVVSSRSERGDRGAPSNNVAAGNNTLMLCYNIIIKHVTVEPTGSYLLASQVITKEHQADLVKSELSQELKMKELMGLIWERSTTAYEHLLSAVEKDHLDVAQTLITTYSNLPKRLKTTDVRTHIKDWLKALYSSRFRQMRPYFWDQTIVTDFRSHCVQLDITDIKGLRSNIPRSRRYQIEKLFTEPGRPRRVLLEGAAGSGKTTYCNKLAYDWSREDYFHSFDFLVLLSTNLIDGSLEDAIFNQLGLFAGDVGLKKEEVMSVMTVCQSRLLFIIDMYDNSTDISPQVLSLLKGEMLEECSIVITCLPNQVSTLAPLADKRLINLGLDLSRQEQLVARYSLLNRGQADEYASALMKAVQETVQENDYMLKLPLMLNLLCLTAQNEEKCEHASTETLQLKTMFEIFPFLYCLQRGIHYDADNPPNDVLYALKQLQCLALETVVDHPTCLMEHELVQQKYGCKLLTQLAILESHERRRDNKPQQILTFRSKTVQEFLAASRLCNLPQDQLRKYGQKLLNNPALRQTLVYFVGCLHHSSHPSAKSAVMWLFNQLGKQNLSKHKQNKDEPLQLDELSLSLDCINECESRKDIHRGISQSLPARLDISPDHLQSSTTVRGLNMILQKNFAKVSHVSVSLSSSMHYRMDILRELAYAIRGSTSVADLHISYTSTELLTSFLSHVTADYRANLLTIVCESKAPSSEKLTASTYTDLKSCISSLSGITAFHLVGCRSSLALRNIVRHLPPILHTFELKECLLDSVSALDVSAYLDQSSGLYVLNLVQCELADGATAMNLFKGVRNNKSVKTLRLRGSTLNSQALKLFCESLKFNGVLQQIDLMQMELSAQVCTSLSSAINASNSLKELRLTTSQTCTDGLKELVDGLKDGFKLVKE